MLQEHDLCGYYQDGVPTGVSQKQSNRDRLAYAILDDPSLAARFIEFTDQRRIRMRMVLPTMHCASCVWLLERLPHIQSGLISAEVDLQRKTIVVDVVPGELRVRDVAELLRSVGYEPLVHVEGTELSGEQQRKEATRGLYLRLGVAGFAMGNIMMFSIAQYVASRSGIQRIDPNLAAVFTWLSIGLSIPVYVFSASPWLRSAWAAFDLLPKNATN